MIRKIPLKKVVVEWRYKPDLGFYGKMDAAALEVSQELPDWERSPLSVEVRDKKRHRRLFLSHNRSFFEVDDASPDADFSIIDKVVKKVFTKLGISTFLRVGLRQWFAADLEKSFAWMVDKVARRFLNQGPELTGILVDKVTDVGYVVDYQAAEGWKYNLRLGPMTRKQWFEVIYHEADIYEPMPDDSGETLKQYRESFPEQFLHIDVDCFGEDYPADKVVPFVTEARRKTHDLAGKLIDYCKREGS